MFYEIPDIHHQNYCEPILTPQIELTGVALFGEFQTKWEDKWGFW